MKDRVGQQLGDYHIIRFLKFGFAEVYLGEHIHLNTFAAIKLLNNPSLEDGIERFCREAKMVAQLVHPNIIQVLNFGVDSNKPFIVTTYVPNGDLLQRYPRGTLLPLTTIVSYVNQI